MFEGLSLDQAPPISVPFRFFLTAPFFGLLTVFILGSDFSNRWDLSVLAAVHLFSVGYITMVMVGALFQMLPVVAGAPVKASKGFAWVIHLGLILGVLGLGLGFKFPQIFPLALLVPLVLLIFVVLLLEALFRSAAAYETVTALKLGVLSLLVILIFGTHLLIGHMGWGQLIRPSLTDLHLTWAFVGWIGFVVIGVSYQVIPMFFVTSSYPEKIKRWLVPALFVILLLRFGEFYFLKGVHLSKWAFIFVLMLYLTCTWVLLHNRRRQVPDRSLYFWRSGLIFGFLALSLWAGIKGAGPKGEMLLGILFFISILSIITAMLYKIVPFLVWFHLQGFQMEALLKGVQLEPLPHMKQIQPDFLVTLHFCIYLIGVLIFILSLFFTQFRLTALGLLALSFALQSYNLITAIRLYSRHKSRMHPQISKTLEQPV